MWCMQCGLKMCKHQCNLSVRQEGRWETSNWLSEGLWKQEMSLNVVDQQTSHVFHGLVHPLYVVKLTTNSQSSTICTGTCISLYHDSVIWLRILKVCSKAKLVNAVYKLCTHNNTIKLSRLKKLWIHINPEFIRRNAEGNHLFNCFQFWCNTLICILQFTVILNFPIQYCKQK